MELYRLIDRLGHMLAAIEAIQEYTAGRTFDEYESDPLRIAAVERNIERLSEASRYIPDDLKARHPEIPWRQLADIGNVMRHAYDQIAAERIWQVVTDDLMPLKHVVEKMRLEVCGSDES